MKKYTFNAFGKTYDRITKRRARKEWAAGKCLALCPCNLSPLAYNSSFVAFVNLSDAEMYDNLESDFDKLCNAFEWYNCNNSESGKYAAFYLESED